LRGHGFSFQSCIEVGLSFCGRDVSDRLEEATVVEPVDPFEGCVFDGLEAAPRTAAVDDLRLEQAVDRLGQGIVIAVADASDRGFDSCFYQPFGVFDGQVLGGFNRSSPTACGAGAQTIRRLLSVRRSLPEWRSPEGDVPEKWSSGPKNIPVGRMA